MPLDIFKCQLRDETNKAGKRRAFNGYSGNIVGLKPIDSGP